MLDYNCSVREVHAAVASLNLDASITGIVCSRPVPAHYTLRDLHESVHPLKDIEGVWG